MKYDILEFGDLSPLCSAAAWRRVLTASRLTHGSDKSQPKQKRWQVSALQKLPTTLR